MLDLDRNDAAAPLAYHRGRFRTLEPVTAPAAWAIIDAADLQAAW